MQTIPSQANESVQTARPAKPLWAAIGVLGIAVVGLAGSLVYVQTRSEPVAPAPAERSPVGAVAGSTLAPMRRDIADETLPAAPAPARVVPVIAPPAAAVRAPTFSAAPAGDRSGRVVRNGQQNGQQDGQRGVYASDPYAATTRHGVYTSQPAAGGAAQPGVYTSQPTIEPPHSRALCANCGTVMSVSSVQRSVATNGTGAVAGGVLGAVVGNQIGHGSGRAAATVLGALGGGWAGNHVEKQIKQHTAYVVQVRMENGKVRTVEQSRFVAVGSPVVVQGGVVRLARS